MATIAGYDLYGGATVTTIIDGSGAEWIACCAKKQSDGVFGFRLFRNRVEVAYSPFCSGRGSINGGGKWIAWEGSSFFMGSIPGFVPFPAAEQGLKGDKGDKGDPGIPGPPGDGGSGLTAEQQTVLQYLVSVYAPLLGI